MPIKGVSDVRRLPRLGKIRLGEKQISDRTGREYPQKLDYFLFAEDEVAPEVRAAVFALYGEQPRELDIMFPVEDLNIVFPQWYKRYGSSRGLICKGDGVTAVQIDQETGEMLEITCAGEMCPHYESKQCRRVASAQFMLPKVPGLGCWQIDTTSFHSIVNINSGIDFIRSITGGRIAMLPLKLRLRPLEVAPEGKKTTVFVMDLIQDQARLEDVIRTAAQPLSARFALDGPTEDRAPDDLFPQGVLEGTRGQRRPLPAPEEVPVAPVSDDPMVSELHRLWDKLATPQAKRVAILSKPDIDLSGLLDRLLAEVESRDAAKTLQASPATETQPPPPPPTDVPPAQPAAPAANVVQIAGRGRGGRGSRAPASGAMRPKAEETGSMRTKPEETEQQSAVGDDTTPPGRLF